MNRWVLCAVLCLATAACVLFPSLTEFSPVAAAGDSGNSNDSGVEAAVPEGAVLYFPFEEGTGSATFDKAGQNVSANVILADWTTGKIGNALAFNTRNLPDATTIPFASDASISAVDINGSSSAAFDKTSSLTVVAWVRAVANPVDDAPIVSSISDTQNGFQLDTTIDLGQRAIGFKLLGGVTADGGYVYAARYGKTPLTLGQWQHIAGVYDATAATLHVYLNGAPDDGTLTGTVPSSRQASKADVLIGRRPKLVAPFIGTLDEVRIYDRALSSTEIAALYQVR